MSHPKTETYLYSKDLENESAMSSVRRCAVITIGSLEFFQKFESTTNILVSMSLDGKRKKKLKSKVLYANKGEPFTVELNGEFQLFYSHNVKYHRDPKLRIAIENTRAKTFSRHRSIADAFVSLQQIVQQKYNGSLTLYECHTSERNPLARMSVSIESFYADDQDVSGESDEDIPYQDESSDSEEETRGIAKWGKQLKSMFSGNGSNSHLNRRNPSENMEEGGESQPSLASPPRLITRESNPETNSDIDTDPMQSMLSPRSLKTQSHQSHQSHQKSKRMFSSDSSGTYKLGGNINTVEGNELIGEENGMNTTETVKLDYVAKYKQVLELDTFQSVLILMDSTRNNQSFLQYLSSQEVSSPVSWSEYIVSCNKEECLTVLPTLYNLYYEKSSEKDMETLRVFLFGDDSYCWYAMMAYLSIVNENPHLPYPILFLPMLLTSSLSYLIALQSPPYLQIIQNIHRFLQSSSHSSMDVSKVVWSTYHVEQDLLALLQADFSTLQVPLCEVSLQHQEEEQTILQNPSLGKLLNVDGNKSGKLKIPFLSTVSLVSPLPYSTHRVSVASAYILNKGGTFSFPNLADDPVDGGSTLIDGVFDYWIQDGNESKQIAFNGKPAVCSIQLEKEIAEEKEEEEEIGFRMEISIPPSSLTGKLKRAINNKLMLNEINSTTQNHVYYSCISKLMVTFNKERVVYIDGLRFSGVTFMTVSNKYYSRSRAFPICIPFVDSHECIVCYRFVVQQTEFYTFLYTVNPVF